MERCSSSSISSSSNNQQSNGGEGDSEGGVEVPATADSLASVLHQSQQRRNIYSIEFKIKVLNFYHCAKNQRLTAKKFNIHRRQIQKWLEIEEHLRNIAQEKMLGYYTTEDQALNLCTKKDEGRNCVIRDEAYDLSLNSSKVEKAPAVTVTGKRRSFTLQFKLNVLDAFYSNAACQGNQRATARLYGINRRQVQKWLCQEQQLRTEAANHVSSSSDSSEPATKRQRLGKWVWNAYESPQNSQQVSPEPPQESALCLVKKEETRKKEEISTSTTSVIISTTTSSTSPIKAKRQSYPLDFKIQALNAYYEDMECKGNQRAVAKRFSIHRRQIQKWLKQEEQLRQRCMQETQVQLNILKPVQQSTPWRLVTTPSSAQCWS